MGNKNTIIDGKTRKKHTLFIRMNMEKHKQKTKRKEFEAKVREGKTYKREEQSIKLQHRPPFKKTTLAQVI